MMVQFVVKGPPVPKEQVRVAYHQSNVCFYNKTQQKENHFAKQVKEIMVGLLSDGQSYYKGRFLEIFLFFKFRRPNYHFVGSNRTSNLLKNDLLQFPTQCDVDNLAKFVMMH